MSQVYSTEPATTGRVLLETSAGPIEVHLWTKECPTASRLFLQLCMDGYYNDNVWHRIVDQLLIQTGLVRRERNNSHSTTVDNNSESSMAVYWKRIQSQNPKSSGSSSSHNKAQQQRLRLELNPRIRFNHRGQVAMALPLADGSIPAENDQDVSYLERQFFITLDEATHLNQQHVIFGTVQGPTIFNALRIGRTTNSTGDGPNDNDEEEAQVPTDDAPIINSVKIVEQPFSDLVETPAQYVPWKQQDQQSKSIKKKKKRKGKKDFNVLSFGNQDDQEEDDLLSFGRGGIQSSHDVLLGGGGASHNISTAKTTESPKIPLIAEKDKVVDKKPSKRRIGTMDKGLDTSMHKTYIPLEEANESMETTRSNEGKNQSMDKNGNVNHQHQQQPRTELPLSKEEKPIRKERRNEDEEREPKKARLSAVEARRQKFLKRTAGGGTSASTQEDTLAKLAAFRSKVLSMKKQGASSSKNTDSQKNDASLASRMAQRYETTNEESMNGAHDAGADTTYHGQILESDEDEDGDTFQDGGRKATDWLGTKFNCRRHVDHASRGLNAGGDSNTDHTMVDGGDGRNVDQYEVIDSKHEDVRATNNTGTSSNSNPSHHGKHHRHHRHEKRSPKEPNSTSRHKRHRR